MTAASVCMFFELLRTKMFVKEHFEKIGTYQPKRDFLDRTLLMPIVCVIRLRSLPELFA